MISIRGKVGRSGVNRPVDVMIVQHLLNLNAGDAGLLMTLGVTGDITNAEISAIRAFQSSLGSRSPDGRIDPGGNTLRALARPVATSTALAQLRTVAAASWQSTAARPNEVSSALGIIDAPRFLARYDRQFSHLGASARRGLEWLIGFINADQEITDVGHAAYMLATVKHECANTFLPIEEYGKGAGHRYGNTVTVVDPSGRSHANKYYGRGYVQLTWKDNYKNLGQALGLGDDLMYDPSLALDPEVAYAIMSYGMRNGSFTTKKLSDYINNLSCDYVGARRIINGTDNDTLIAGYAEQIELLLRASAG